MRTFGLFGAALGLLSAIGTLAFAESGALADSKKPVVALANGFYGNVWRHELDEEFVKAAKKAKADGRISDYFVVNGDGSTTQMAAQIGEVILKKPDLLIIDPTSGTALNGVIQRACSRGMVVLSFDNSVSAPCAYNLLSSFQYEENLAENVIKLMGGKGNLLLVRGLSGTTVDNDDYHYWMQAIKRHPDVKVIGTVYGGWSNSVAQAATTNVLPTLPHVDGVVTEGADAFGTARAFDLAGGDYVKHPPIIAGDNTTEILHWWAAKTDKLGYKSISGTGDPGSVAAALWYGLDILSGKIKPDKTAPNRIQGLTITQDELPKYKDFPPGRVIVSEIYTPEWVENNLEVKK
jgi:ribose transport system substrate-binding protein